MTAVPGSGWSAEFSASCPGSDAETRLSTRPERRELGREAAPYFTDIGLGSVRLRVAVKKLTSLLMASLPSSTRYGVYKDESGRSFGELKRSLQGWELQHFDNF